MIELHVRHGQSSPSTGTLQDEGKEQAHAAGDWIRRNFQQSFDLLLHSPSSRARDTATLFDLPEPNWAIVPLLSEKTAGESWESVIARVGSVADRLDSRSPSNNRILVYHGDAMRGMRAYRENLAGDGFGRLYEEPYKYFNNCQIIIYSDIDPVDGGTKPGQLWVKSVCPWADGRFGHDWMRVSSD